MSLTIFVIPFLLLTTAVQRGASDNNGYVTMPLFEMLAKNLPQDETETNDEYTGADENATRLIVAYFDKVKVIDAWKASSLSLDFILSDKTSTVITDARVLYERTILFTENLVGYNCTRYCYNVSVPTILSVTGWTEDRLDGKVDPIVRLRDIHNAIVKAIEERFCCNMTEIAIRLGLDAVSGVQDTAAYFNVWKTFVPHVNEAAVKCKADALQVTEAELAELLRTDLATIYSYDLNEMDKYFFPAYEDLLARKNLFETRSIITGVLTTFINWQSGTMARFADIVSQFTPRDLEILYRWQAPQLFAIENIPMSIFETGCGTVSLSDPLFTLSQTLFGFSTNLPDCNVAFLLSRSFNEVDTKFTVSSLSTQNVLEIFRTESQRPSWFDNDIYELLQLNIDEGIWVETPTLSQIAIFSGTTINSFTAASSIPIAIRNIKNFNTSSTLNTIMQTNYISFLTKLLNTYGYTSSGLATAAGITVAQINSMTIQQAHSLIVDSIQARYRINDLASLLGIAGVNTHVLINLPSFEWDRIVMVAIQNAFAQSADAYSVLLSGGGLQIVTIEGGFPAIQVTNSATYHTDRVTPTELANCINRTLSEIYAMSFAEYHQLHINSIVPLLRNKITFETQTMESLLNSLGLDFDNEKSRSVAEVITRLTGLTTANLQCMFGWSSTFLNTDLAMTFQTANETRLCNDFLGRTMFDIVTIINQTANKVCFLCTIDPCGANTMCKDIPDSFQCTCNAGYTGNAIQGCIDIPECLLIDLNDCHVNATCNELPGSFECTCKDGFVGNGRICLDTDECATDPTRCGANGVCHNTIGSFYCDCESGWRWNGTTCEDINECEENTDNCHALAVCTNTIGSFTCHCPNGLTGDGLVCEDILECNFQAGLFPCHARANCIETIGAFICQCQDGYTGDGQICTDINECDENTDDCHVNADCLNTVPGFVCDCHDGFQGDGRTCTDVDECQMDLDNCHVNANCLNNVGSFQCECKDGFNGNGTYCYVAEVSFTRASAAVNEGDDEEITLYLNGEIDEIAVVNIVVNGTATEGTDYVTFTKAFVFNPGDASTRTFTIDTIDDERLEGLETIILQLTSLLSHVTPGNVPSMTVTIIDNDAVGVGFSQQAYTANEVNNGFANVVVAIRSGIVEKDITVSFSTAPGTAVVNGDFTAHTQQVIFAPGNTASKVVRVPLVNDDRTEGDEQFSVFLSTSDTDVNIVNSPATVTIVDDDVATVRLDDASYTIAENGNALTVTLLVTGVRDIDLTARLSTGNAGAMAGNDYTSLVNRNISIPRLLNTVSTTITILEDNIVENDETFSVTLSSQSSPQLVTANPAVAVVTIEDNDVASVQFSQSTYSTQENTTQVNVRVTVTGSFEKSLQLSLSTSDDSATSANNDYQQYTGTITFNPGDPNWRDVPIQILEDNLIENTESLIVELSSTDSDIVFPSGRTATINILDDDVATAFIQNAEYTFNENTVTTNIPISLQGNLAIPVTVRLSTSPGTANWPFDFTAISNHEIEFRPGEASTQQLALNIMDDEVVESTEMFSVILSTGDSKVTIGQFGTTTVNIVDNDQIEVHFSSSHYEADEDSGFALIGLVLVDTLETTARVRLTPSNGTATEPEDFPLLNYDVTLTAGQPRTEYYRINITNDMLEEYTEHFYVLLTAIDVNVQIVDPRLANISIGESDDINFCDPNARQYPCHIKADCRDVPGSFRCTCVTGYEGDGLSCTNINECDTINCPFNATCQDNPGSYTCICKAGFRGDGVNCIDINECAEDTDNCHARASCQNTLGGYECQCNEGWLGDGRNCSNINECQQVNDCHNDANCFDTEGSYICQCKNGFTGDGRQCVDIDECTENTHNCHVQATCLNNRGSFGCQCNVGWSGDGITCSDINECDQDNLNDCHDDASCFNTDGNYTCQCKNGFTGDGKQCMDIDECATNTDNCPDNSVCNNTHGGFDCICNPGFIHRNSICEDVDECTDGGHNCHADADCRNMPGTFHCNCKVGFTGNGTFCTNLNECALVPGPCDPAANCQDTHGSFNCTCWPGYTGNGTHCEDIIDCILLPRQYPCDIRATCRDVPGGFTCTCPTGFVLNADNKNCDDVNECEAMTYSCHANASCVNVPGSYDCQCNENFVGDGKINCVDTTCSTGNPCSPDADCSVNVTTSSYHCVCHQGFTGNGITCNEINECLISGSCGSNTDCVNLPRGSHTCTCKSGYTGDPNVNCFDIDECENNPCHVNATCSNSPGTFTCACNSGFSGDGNNFCDDINECNVAGTCDANADCTNTVGDHYCTCHQGYTGDGKDCAEINICGTPQDDCSTFATCADTGPATYTCTCILGYTGDGKVCDDINECDGNPCEEDGAVCANTPGSYTCSCPEDLYNNGNLCYVFCPFKLDLAFIVDTSDSIDADDFAKVKEFMTETIGRMEIGENGNHIAAISFGNTAKVFMRFNTVTGAALTRSNLKNQFANFPKDGGLTRIDLALHHADTDVFTEASGMRTASDIRKVAVVLTDGEQTMGPGVPIEPLSHYARRLQARDITVLAVGIGASVPRDQLLNLTNSIEENILEVNSFENLLSIINQFINTSCTDVNECDLYDDVCHENANCKDTLGAYTCLCNLGYDGDGFDCEDINECDGQNGCDQNSNCTNTAGSYECTCKDGYSGNGRVCQDIDECDLNTHGCHEKADCSNTEGSYTCACSAGYTGDGRISCTDTDECDTGDHNCHAEATCMNSDGSYTCTCNPGYTGDGRNCQDVDECAQNTDECHDNAECSNNVGSYTCACSNGYSGDGRTSCEDINECDAGNHNCHGQAECRNSDGSFVCTCNQGYTGDGRNCQDIDECDLDTDDCHERADCSNIEGSFTCACSTGYTGDGKISCTASGCSITCISEAECRQVGLEYECVCKTGYTGDGTSCTDIDECDVNTHNCHAQATCQNNPGGFGCQCNEGWSGDGTSCSDIDECAHDNLNDCDDDASCTNIDAGYLCHCKPGFTGNGKQCANINECDGGNVCDINADCMDTQGSYTCQCKDGYTGNGTTCHDTRCGGTCDSNADCRQDGQGQNFNCVCRTGFSGDGTACSDIDECTTGHDCHANATCANNRGSYTCTCRPGFTGDGKNCANINECNGENNCDINAECTDNVGNYSCQCKTGYIGTGFDCANVNECDGENNCDVNADCTDNVGGYSCQCKTGYSGDGFSCTVISGCENCPTNSECTNEQGTYRCACKNGYSNAVDAATCADVNECTQSPCGDDQACRNYPGTYDCYCTSPGKYLNQTSKTCIDVSSVSLQITILNRLFDDALASQSSLEFYEFTTRLRDRLNDYFKAIYRSSYIDSLVVNLSNGSVVANIILIFKPGKVPSARNLQESFIKYLNVTNNKMMLDDYEISESSSKVEDYDECDPMLTEHSADCPENSYCDDTYGSYSCQCSKGYEKHKDHDICVGEDDDWWIIYAVVFGAIGFVVLALIILFCFLEVKRNEELYTLHGEARPHDKRIDEEVAPGFPGSVPRTSSSTSQLLLSADKTQGGTEKLAMYEVNPIYDSANG